MCIRKDSTGKLWLQLSLTRSESWVQFRIHLATRLIARAVFSFLISPLQIRA